MKNLKGESEEVNTEDPIADIDRKIELLRKKTIHLRMVKKEMLLANLSLDEMIESKDVGMYMIILRVVKHSDSRGITLSEIESFFKNRGIRFKNVSVYLQDLVRKKMIVKRYGKTKYKGRWIHKDHK